MRVTVICLFAIFSVATSFRCCGLAWSKIMNRAGVLLKPVASVKHPFNERLDPSATDCLTFVEEGLRQYLPRLENADAIGQAAILANIFTQHYNSMQSQDKTFKDELNAYKALRDAQIAEFQQRIVLEKFFNRVVQAYRELVAREEKMSAGHELLRECVRDCFSFDQERSESLLPGSKLPVKMSTVHHLFHWCDPQVQNAVFARLGLPVCLLVPDFYGGPLHGYLSDPDMLPNLKEVYFHSSVPECDDHDFREQVRFFKAVQNITGVKVTVLNRAQVRLGKKVAKMMNKS